VSITDDVLTLEPPPSASLYEQFTFYRGHVAAQTRRANQKRPGAARALDHYRSQLAAVQIEMFVRKHLDNAPPLSDGQRARLAQLLSPVRG
jgi:hypothetical protein